MNIWEMQIRQYYFFFIHLKSFSYIFKLVLERVEVRGREINIDIREIHPVVASVHALILDQTCNLSMSVPWLGVGPMIFRCMGHLMPTRAQVSFHFSNINIHEKYCDLSSNLHIWYVKFESIVVDSNTNYKLNLNVIALVIEFQSWENIPNSQYFVLCECYVF